jgi:hypothetical protein
MLASCFIKLALEHDYLGQRTADIRATLHSDPDLRQFPDSAYAITEHPDRIFRFPNWTTLNVTAKREDLHLEFNFLRDTCFGLLLVDTTSNFAQIRELVSLVTSSFGPHSSYRHIDTTGSSIDDSDEYYWNTANNRVLLSRSRLDVTQSIHMFFLLIEDTTKANPISRALGFPSK